MKELDKMSRFRYTIDNIRDVTSKNGDGLATGSLTINCVEINTEVENCQDNLETIAFGEFKNVLMTEEEFKKLTTEYNRIDAHDFICQLDSWIEECKGKEYQDEEHYEMIKRWIERAGYRPLPKYEDIEKRKAEKLAIMQAAEEADEKARIREEKARLQRQKERNENPEFNSLIEAVWEALGGRAPKEKD